MTLFTHMLGWSFFGLGSRLWQLGIQQRPLHANPGWTALAMGSFAGIGYFSYGWQEKSREILAEQRARVESKKKHRLEQLQQFQDQLERTQQKLEEQAAQ